jgi:hypothetical protein
VRNKLKAQGKLEEEGMSRAAKGYEKYGKQGMEALAKAGREGKALDPIRKKYDKYNNTEVDEGVMDTVKSIGKKVASGINRLVGHGSDEEMLKDLQRRAGAPVTGKKPTFADKIDNAKKEVDEMLGDVAAEAMRNALSPKQKKIDMNKNGKLDANDFAMLRKGAKPGGKDEMDEENAFTAHKRPSADRPKVGSIERGAKHDIEHTATGRKVTRRTDDQGISVGADDDSEATGEKRGRGRPKGTKNVGSKAKVFQRKSKLMTKEGDQDITDQGEYDQEGDMAKDDIKTIVRHAQALSKVLGDNDNLPEWVQSKLAKIEGMMISIDEYMQNQASDDGEEEPIAEKAVSKQQQKFMGMAHAMQKGEKIPGASKELKKVAKTMKKKDVEDFAKTKHKGLPDKVKSKKEEEVEESSTTSGSVAPSTASAGGKGAVFGKGIYDSINRELEAMIAESMNISMNMSNDAHGGPSKSLTVTATDEDAIYLGKLLKMAGLGSGNNSCGCGTSPCSCGSDTEVVDENSPDWPTNSETNDDALQYSGGVNGPKSTGQTVGAPFNRQASRQGEGITDVLENDEVGDIKNLAGIQETKKVEEDDVEEGNKFTGNLAKARAAGKEEADLDGDGDLEKVRESINNLWKTYRG